MRFLHVVALPSVFVFASKVDRLQALESDSDEKDVLADAYSRSDDAAVVSEEDRSFQTFLQSLLRGSAAAPKASSTMSVAEAAKVVQSAESVGKGAPVGKKHFSRLFQDIVKQKETSGENFDSYVGSAEYFELIAQMYEANRKLYGKKAIQPYEFFVKELPRKKLALAIDGALKSSKAQRKTQGELLKKAAHAKLAKMWNVAAKDVPAEFYKWRPLKIFLWKLNLINPQETAATEVLTV
uniref:RxLR effector candidate protein n=1 Tax=Peronospora matthiolae TaxID=2874970 RepID=A0AAV1TZE7_9STRA